MDNKIHNWWNFLAPAEQLCLRTPLIKLWLMFWTLKVVVINAKTHNSSGLADWWSLPALFRVCLVECVAFELGRVRPFLGGLKIEKKIRFRAKFLNYTFLRFFTHCATRWLFVVTRGLSAVHRQHNILRYWVYKTKENKSYTLGKSKMAVSIVWWLMRKKIIFTSLDRPSLF